jgi:hypothetical protein
MKTKIKTHSMPGDVSKQAKQSMLEGTTKRYYSTITVESAKKWKKDIILSRERAILKRRTKKLIKEET